jgi:membrane protein YqaA with SNARE-associated domain
VEELWLFRGFSSQLNLKCQHNPSYSGSANNLSLGGILNPLLLGLSSGLAAAIGETTGYLAGYSGQAIAKRSKKYDTMVNLTRKWGVLAIFVFTLIPFLPFDIVGITAGLLRFQLWKYFLVCWVGRTMLYTFVAWAGAFGWDAVSQWFH